ncbi:MAG: glutathione peroxidase [Oligoflexales bacterium]
MLKKIGTVSIMIAMMTSPLMAKGSFHGFKAETIERKKIDFKQFKGKVLLVANIASKCGYTPQLKGLQTLHTKYKKAAFEVVGFPSNDFNQEPLAGVKIGEFCKRNYGVDFTIFKKVHVKGKNIDPIYKYLTSNSPKKSGVNWNFEKFLVDASGKVVKHYPSSIKPNDPNVLQDIERLVKAGS